MNTITPMPISPAVSSSVLEPPVRSSSARASIGSVTFTIWFQAPVTTTATAIAFDRYPQLRSIAYDAARPTASPPGTAIEIADEVWVSTIDWR